MDTDRTMKAVKKLLLTKYMLKSSNKLRNLQTGDHDERKNLCMKAKPRKESQDAARTSRSFRSSGRSNKTNKSISNFRMITKRVKKRQVMERTLERLSQEYMAYEADISDTFS